MKALEVIVGLLSIFITFPIWIYLLYSILRRVEATELMWFLFWIYLPLGFLLAIVEDDDNRAASCARAWPAFPQLNKQFENT